MYLCIREHANDPLLGALLWSAKRAKERSDGQMVRASIGRSIIGDAACQKDENGDRLGEDRSILIRNE